MFQVYDNVLPLDTLYHIQNGPMDFLGEKSPVIRHEALPDTMNENQDDPNNALAVVKKLSPEGSDVEIWGRHMLTSVPFHMDCDEDRLTEKHELATPKRGNILCLKVHHPAPTLIFGDDQLCVIPPRQNRLVTFAGNLLHMIYPIKGIEERRRSTILFNIWDHDELPNVVTHVDTTDGDPLDSSEFNNEVGVEVMVVDDESMSQTITFPAMYKDRYATNCPDLPRDSITIKVFGTTNFDRDILEMDKTPTVFKALRIN